MILNIYKKVGETPLEAMRRVIGDEKGVYAGRLDPMAEGVLIVLTEEDIYKAEEFFNLDKEYEFEGLLGIKSDTYDILGLVKNVSDKCDWKNVLSDFVGTKIQKYPPFSSKTVNGKPLFQITKDGDKVQIPYREIEIYSLDLINLLKIKLKDLNIIERIKLVKGDFRQEEILKAWEEIPDREVIKFKCKIKCSSGTYVRSIVNEIGNRLGCGAITYNIKRTKVGKYTILTTS